MPLPNTFATQPTGTVLAATLDQNFAAVAAMGVIPCTATGTNAITLAPTGSVPAVTAYTTFQQFGFIAVATATGALTIQVGTLAALPAFLADGITPVGAGNVVLGAYYVAVFNQALNANNGGFQFASLLAPPQSVPAAAVPIRQTVQTGGVDSNGAANFISVGTGLACNLSATAIPVGIAFAAGYNAGGGVDFIGRLTADTSSFWSSFPANSTTFLSVDRNTGTGALTATQTLAPVQYGYAYDRTRQAVLQFGGAAGSTTFLDDFGNTWTAQGGAKVQTNQFKFGTGGLGGGGTLNALNGTTDFVKSTNFLSLGDGGWAMRAWVNPSALPGSGLTATICSFANGNNCGATLGIFNSAGTIKFYYQLSSDGTTLNIASNVQGTTTPVVGTWYFVELTYDVVAGVYRLYVNGVQESSTASASKICEIPAGSVGASPLAANFLNGYIDKFELLPYCPHPNGTAYSVPTGAPSITTAGYASDWFDTANMVMRTLVGGAASGVAGTNPTFAILQRVYVGEATTGAATVSSTVNYALQGSYVGAWVTPLPGVTTLISKNHNLGTSLADGKIELLTLRVDAGLGPGPVGAILTQIGGIDTTANPRTPPLPAIVNRNSVMVQTSNNSTGWMTVGSNGAGVGLTVADYAYRFKVKRSF